STSLDNLSTSGQMIIDSANGTISNCILEIPQNIKLTLENNVLTLKAGSVITRTGENYTTITTTEDQTFNLSTLANGRYLQCAGRTSGNLVYHDLLSKFGSGNALPADGTMYSKFYLTTDKIIYSWHNNIWEAWTASYPICVFDVENGVASFAKDSNGNDMIFNGAGFIGHHAFFYPEVAGLKSNGFNEDGSFASNAWTNNSLQIIELDKTQSNIMNRIAGIITRNYFDDIKNAPNDNSKDVQVGYDKEKNQMFYRPHGTSDWTSENGNYLNLVDYTYNGTTVTDFTIRQPYQGARNLLTDDLYKQIGDVETLLATI
ncbi:MAG: hypothetical protein IJ677_04375, partial [Alphaproteobacteria bacterium]|nr:hypothetical protein [Alphaproteobacteria bacterium]